MRWRTPGSYCLVVSELLGHQKAGGIATATSFLAELLADAGHHVTLLDTSEEDQALSVEWRDRYRLKGIAVERLRRTDDVGPPFVADSYRVYQALKKAHHDVIVFQDWLGLGYCSMSAKSSGLAFAESRLVHIVHGPTPWLWEANQNIDLDTGSFAYSHIEQRAAELADTVVGPSTYLLDWMSQRWNLPNDVRQIFYPTAQMVGVAPAGSDRHSRSATTDGPQPLRELVFFGRYEERKGIRLFTQALNRLGAEALRGLRITFLGRAALFSTDEVTEFIDRNVRDVIDGPHFITDRDSLGARSYLSGPGRVALIPSLIDNSPNVVIECIEDGVSFLAAASGGIPELVAAADRSSVLFEPNVSAFTARLSALIESGQVSGPARQGWVDAEILPAWEAMLEPVPAAPLTPAADPMPLVSVVIPHYAQLELFTLTLRSVVAQDYPNIEIVVVDDGTPDEEVVRELSALLAEPWGWPITFIRQENGYLGAARNAGVAAAQGQWVAFVDDDDILEPEYVSTLMTAARCTGASAVSSVLVTYPDDGSYLSRSRGTPFVFVGDAPQLCASWNTVGGAGCLVAKEAWEAVEGFHTRHGVGHEDWTLLLSIALTGRRVVAVPEPLYRYRIRATSMIRTTSRYRNMRPVFDAYSKHLPDQLQSWSELIHGQQQIIDAMWGRESNLRQELEIVRQAGARMLGEIEALQAERDAMKASLTWRLGSTALQPVRVLRRLRSQPPA